MLEGRMVMTSTDEFTDPEWSYDGKTGPHSSAWPPLCHFGKRQSPINIDHSSVVRSPLSPLQFFGYNLTGNITIANMKHTVKVTGFKNWGIQQPYIFGANLSAKYNLVEIHFHWGKEDGNGSEHTFNNVHYSLEAHFVHHKEGTTEAQAKTIDGGIAVLAVFFREDNSKSGQQPLSQLEPAIIRTNKYGSIVNLTNLLLENLIPKKYSNFYRYNGSLTTPNCEEVVIWTLLQTPLTISTKQLQEFRQHYTTTGKLTHNLRETQPLNGRKVSFYE